MLMDSVVNHGSEGDNAMNFRIPKNKTIAYAGPEYPGCFGSCRPVIACFKRPGWLIGSTKHRNADVRVWFVAMTIPELLMDSDTRRTYDNVLFKTGYRKLRSFGKGNDKVRVFYTRASAVAAFDKLVAERKAEIEAARAEAKAARDEINNATTYPDAVNALIKNLDVLS